MKMKKLILGILCIFPLILLITSLFYLMQTGSSYMEYVLSELDLTIEYEEESYYYDNVSGFPAEGDRYYVVDGVTSINLEKSFDYEDFKHVYGESLEFLYKEEDFDREYMFPEEDYTYYYVRKKEKDAVFAYNGKRLYACVFEF